MKPTTVSIRSIESVTHNVKRFRLDKPSGLSFIPGQAADISINKPGWIEAVRPFTFTGLSHWDFLEFTIKIYSDHPGVTNELGKLIPGDEIIIHHVFGAIRFYGAGTFIAGGAGVTPFIAIFRQLQAEMKLGNNMLIFSNNASRDIILREEFQSMLGSRFINTLTRESTPEYDHRYVNRDYLQEKVNDFSQYFYLCGPDAMVEGIHQVLLDLGADQKKIIIEQF